MICAYPAFVFFILPAISAPIPFMRFYLSLIPLVLSLISSFIFSIASLSSSGQYNCAFLRALASAASIANYSGLFFCSSFLGSILSNQLLLSFPFSAFFSSFLSFFFFLSPSGSSLPLPSYAKSYRPALLFFLSFLSFLSFFLSFFLSG